MLKRVQGDEAREDPSRFSPPGARCAAVHRFANPARFLKLARPLTPACILAGLLLAAIGIYGGLFLTPPAYLQGESVPILFVPVPAAWLGLAGYGFVPARSTPHPLWQQPHAAVGGRGAAP